MKFVVLAVAALTVAASSAGWKTFHGDGVSYRYPPGWFATGTPLTAVTSPGQVMALASYRFPTDVAGADGCEPQEALDPMPVNGAFIYGWEYGRVSARLGIRPADFPPKPARFKLTNALHYECLGVAPGYMLRFRDHGLAFQVEVILGKQVSSTTRADALRALESFHVS